VTLAVFMTNLDLWIVNVALPAMGDDFQASLSDLSWVLNAYAITLAALLVVAGRLGDRIGQRPVFLAGVILFTLASVACAAAPTLGWLVAARVVQAVGAAAQLPTSLGLLLAAVPENRRTAATRSWAAVGGLAAASGPVAGGLLVELDWRWVFVVNLPIGLLALVAGLIALPRPAARETGPLPDLLGAVLVTVAVATGAWFALRSARHRSPLLELPLLRLPRFGASGLGTLTFGVAFAIMLLSNVLWCQEVWHWSALRTGLALVPGPALVPIVTVLTVRAVHRFGHGRLVALGGLLFAAGMLWRVAVISVEPDYVRDLLPSLILSGTGVGLAMGTLIAAGVQSLPGDRAATGSALVNALRQISASIGVALLVTIVGSTITAGSLSAFRWAWALAAVLAIVTAGIGLTLSRPLPALAPAAR
jgi:MFS family permease